jgi:hypothetical protein
VSTVLIASAEHLAPLKDRGGFAEAQSFLDTEALRALEVITRERPSVVALERTFAATSRGAALINRIKADPALASCEIRIVDQATQAAALAAAPAPVPAPVAVAAGAAAPAAVAAPAGLDQRGTRRAPRTPVRGRVDVLVDGNPAALVDVSAIGAQVVSSTILRPNQRVRIILQDPARPLRVAAGVAWASFEMPKEGVRYRAGLEFFDADAAAVSSWIAKLG